MMGAVGYHPFDINELSKGDFIDARRCENIIGLDHVDPRYRPKLLQLRDWIVREWKNVRGERVAVDTEADGIRVLSDSGMVNSGERRYSIANGVLRRALTRVVSADREALTEEMRQKQERTSVKIAAHIAAGTKAARLVLKPYKRNAPAMLPSKKKK